MILAVLLTLTYCWVGVIIIRRSEIAQPEFHPTPQETASAVVLWPVTSVAIWLMKIAVGR